MTASALRRSGATREQRRGGPATPAAPAPSAPAPARIELLVTVPAGGPPGAVASELEARNVLDGLRHGVTTLILCEDDALLDARTLSQLDLHASAGAQVRSSRTALPRLTVVDGRTALMPFPADGPDHASAMHDLVLVTSLRALFVGLWSHAVDLADRPPGACSERDRQVLRLLDTGVNDATAAREMDVSLRTYRRYVADTLTLLGATSRYQAGVRAARLAWLAPAPAPGPGSSR